MMEADQPDPSVEHLEEFAKNVLHAQKSGPWPLPDMELVVVVLAQMLVTVIELLNVERETSAAGREAGDALAMLLNHRDLKAKKTIPDA